MRIKVTISQLKWILQSQYPKYPIEIMMKNIDKNELLKIGKLLKKKD